MHPPLLKTSQAVLRQYSPHSAQPAQTEPAQTEPAQTGPAQTKSSVHFFLKTFNVV